MYIWGITKKYKGLSWWENFMGGHISIGPVTIFGSNAMNWVMEIRTRWGALCFTLPALARWRTDRYGKKHFHWHIYLSPNCTPWACTFYRGDNKGEVIRAKIRKINFGHNFDTTKHWDALQVINNKFSSPYIAEWEISEYVQRNGSLYPKPS